MHGNLSLIRSIIFILVRSTVASEAFHQLHEKITNLYRYRHVFIEHVQGVAGKAVIYLEHTRTLTSACNLCTAAPALLQKKWDVFWRKSVRLYTG